MWLSSILGLTGPNGKHFCNDCLITLQDVTKGTPHSPVILPKYHEPESEQNRTFSPHTIESITQNAKLFQENGRKIPSDYFNSEHPPLIDACGPVINFTSVAPLHISLGLGLKNLNVTEELAVIEDKKVKGANGMSSDTVADLLLRRDNMHNMLDKLEEENNQLSSCLMASENSLEMLKSKNEFAFEKDAGRFKDISRDVISIRKQATDLKKETDRFISRIKEIEKEEKNTKDKLNEILGTIDK